MGKNGIVRQSYKFDSRLRSFVERITVVEVSANPEEKLKETLCLPWANFFLKFSLGDPVFLTNKTGDYCAEEKRVFSSGAHRGTLKRFPKKGGVYAFVEFRPLGGPANFGVPCPATGVVSSDDVLGRFSKEIYEKLGEAPTRKKKFKILERGLLSLLPTMARPPKSLLFAVDQIVKKGGIIRTRELAEECGLTRQHLFFLFKQWTGVGIKEFSNIVRFNEVVRYLNYGKGAGWVDTAFRFGFNDQSHLISFFKEMVGFSPKKFEKIKPQLRVSDAQNFSVIQAGMNPNKRDSAVL